jgi:ribosomal protein S12 methylthiotransferase
MPLQHIDDDLLKQMRRGHVGKTVRALLQKFRARIPDVTLRTTFIVGHPGESDAAFARLCDFVREAEFDRVGVFTYSNEEGTHSAALTATLGEVPARERERRRRELMRIQRAISRRKMKSMVGRTIEVLVEGPSQESEYLLAGRHMGQAPEIDGSVYLALAATAAPSAGDLVRARVTGFADYDLAATVERVVMRSRVKPVARLPVLRV